MVKYKKFLTPNLQKWSKRKVLWHQIYRNSQKEKVSDTKITEMVKYKKFLEGF